jgi:DNA-binding NarL/FixJ family response regulator
VGNGHPATTVLFIDSHDDERQVWIDRLKISSPDHVVLKASTGKAGLAICRSQQIDCVICELTLPDMSGFEVLVQLVPQARRPEIAFIFLTRLTLVPMRQLGLSNGAQAYLVKSQSSGDQLDSTIRKALARVAPNQENPRSSLTPFD